MTSQQIQYGGRQPYWKSSFGYISTSDYPINAKFCRIKQNRDLTHVTWPKYQFGKFNIADGRHFENSFIAISQPEIIRIQRNLVCRCRLCFQGRLLNKILKFCKFKMADGRHIENRLSAISQWAIIGLTRNFVG